MLRFDHVGVIVEDLDAAEGFFVSLGFEAGGRMHVDGEDVDRINGLDGVTAELVMVRTPDGTGTLELVKYHAPACEHGPRPEPANRLGFRHIAIEIDDLAGAVARLRADGFDLVGEARDFGGVYRLCYVRGPEGLIVELAQRISPEAAPARR